MDISTKLSEDILVALNFTVEKIQESEKKEADFIISSKKCNDNALIEAKLITDDKKEIISREDILTNGGIHTYSAKQGNNNKVSKAISQAKRQLHSSSDKQHKFKLVFFVASGINPPIKAEQIYNTLYGRTEIIVDQKRIECFYYRTSKFYSYQDYVDGAIIAIEDMVNQNIFSLKFCLNTYSKKYEDLKNSCIVSPFTNIIDPLILEQQGNAFIPDDNISRSYTEFEELSPTSINNHMVKHLQEKYKIPENVLIFAADWNTPTITSAQKLES